MALLGIGSLAVLFPKVGAPLLLWNASPSVPIGLYRLTSRPPQTATLAVIRLPEALRILTETRGYLRKGALLIKPVAAGAGDTVCRHGALVTVNGRIVARARTLDATGRSLPVWSGCFRLGASDIFVLSADPDSFDSRYIGPIDHAHVMGFALPIWVRQAAPTKPGCLTGQQTPARCKGRYDPLPNSAPSSRHGLHLTPRVRLGSALAPDDNHCPL